MVYKFFYSDNTSDLYCKIQGEGGVSLSRLAFSHVYECEGITELQIVAGLLVVTQASICVCLFGFLQVLQVLPRVQKHIHQIDWRLKIVPLCVNKCCKAGDGLHGQARFIQGVAGLSTAMSPV